MKRLKGTKGLVSAGLVILLAGSWTSLLGENIDSYRAYAGLVRAAEESREEGLYEQAVELYGQSLSYKNTEKTYKKIKDVYEQYYEEEHTSSVRWNYIGAMEQAAAEYPKNEEFWMTQIALYEEAGSSEQAFDTAKKALNGGIKSEELARTYEKLFYEVRLDNRLYTEVKTCLNGYITVNDGEQWTVLNNDGEQCKGKYAFVGLLNNNGIGIYMNDIDTRLLDKNEIARARFQVLVEDAGYYSESSGYVPVKVDGVWKYLGKDGSYLPGEYEEAGCFYEHKAAVKQGDAWFFIDEQGNAGSEKYEEIGLDLYGNYQQGDVILAKKDGAYHLYDSKFEPIGDFSCEDMDVCINNNLIAFEQNGKWGYVDTEGKVVVEPQYEKAKSFSNGMAAVCDENGRWGFLDSRYKLAVGYEYLDASYFTAAGTCMVRTGENAWQMLKFRFQ